MGDERVASIEQIGGRGCRTDGNRSRKMASKNTTMIAGTECTSTTSSEDTGPEQRTPAATGLSAGGQLNGSRHKPCTHQASPPLEPRSRRASWMSRCMMVTRFAWIAHRFLRHTPRQPAERSHTVPSGTSISLLTRLRTCARGTLLSPPGAPGWLNSATAVPYRRIRPCRSSCLARSPAPVRLCVSHMRTPFAATHGPAPTPQSPQSAMPASGDQTSTPQRGSTNTQRRGGCCRRIIHSPRARTEACG